MEPKTVLEAVKTENVNLTTVLTTHHHWDHAGGNKELLQLKPGLHVVGGDDRIDELKQMAKQDDQLNIGNLKIKCLSTPCHTKGHICYYVTDANGGSKAVFTGDTLFLGGCGRFFEGDGKQMNEALNVKLSQLPDETVFYKVQCPKSEQSFLKNQGRTCNLEHSISFQIFYFSAT